VLDDELSSCLTLLLFSVGKVVSVVLDVLDDELLFAQPQSEPGEAAVREQPVIWNLQKADALLLRCLAQVFILFYSLTSLFMVNVGQVSFSHHVQRRGQVF